MLYFVYYIASLQVTQFDAEGEVNCTITAARTCPFIVMWLNGNKVLINSSDVTMGTTDTLTVTLPLNLQDVMSEDYQNVTNESYTCVGIDNKTMMDLVRTTLQLSNHSK